MTGLVVSWIVLLPLLGLALAYSGASATFWVPLLALWIGAGWGLGLIGVAGAVVLAVVLVLPALLLAVVPLRRALVSGPLRPVFRRIMPRMSETERTAIEAGTVWWDGALFSGRPDWDRLLAVPAPALTQAEQSFLDNETEHLCDLSNDWDATSLWQDLPPEAWDYAKRNGFLGMIIPRRYGGLEFSAYAHSQVIQKLSTRCSAASVSVMVPNSLGPAELLLHYGTERQKDHYLPRLARGDEVPCFALTNPYAGSDAASITDSGIVCRGTFEGRDVLGFRVTWRKRYITLAPIATVLGLAFRAHDPDGLLGGGADLGITCALIPREHPGVVIGRRHWPLNAVFQNGPTSGDDVFIPLDMVIGGREQIGNGWRMLMECLAAGRAISLPSSNVGMCKLALRGVSAYVAIRRQFNLPVGQFEAVQEPLARMAGHLYAIDSIRRLSAAAIDLGERPSVISAIAKYHVTERARLVVNDGMDVIGGKGICMGPGNFLARAYQQIPIAITVEGANIMTRALIIFGQGAIRCHPHVLTLMRAASADGPDARATFDRALFAHLGFILRNVARALCFGLSGNALIRAPRGAAPALAADYRRATRLSTVLALMADVSMATLGGTLKRREAITGRLGDLLSQLFIISSILKRFEDDGRQQADLPLVRWALDDAFARAAEAVSGVLLNYPSRPAALFLRLVAMPFGLRAPAPADRVMSNIAALLRTDGPVRERLLAGSWTPRMEVDRIAAAEIAFRLYPQIEAIEHRLKDAIREKRISRLPQDLARLDGWAQRAEAAGLVSPDERALVARFVEHADLVIQVDDFPGDFGAADNLRTVMQRSRTPSARNAAE